MPTKQELADAIARDVRAQAFEGVLNAEDVSYINALAGSLHSRFPGGSANPTPPPTPAPPPTVSKGKLSPNFSLAEMIKSATADRIKDPNQPNADEIASLKVLCEKVLEPLRAAYRKPIRVNSGFRSARTNAAVGSKPDSQHRRGEAADIEIDGVSNYEVAKFIRDNLPFDQLILENHKAGDPNSGWVHVSYRAGRLRKDVKTMTLGTHGAVYSAGIGA